MAEPKTTGNVADEQHQDFSEANSSAAPPTIDPITVDHERVEDGIILRPEHSASKPARGVGDLQEGAREQMAAQIFEDPTMLAPARGQIEKRSTRGALVWWAIRPNKAAAMWGDRVLIRRDTMESAYSCRNCKGKGHTDEQCPTCKGEALEKINGSEFPCRTCQVLGYDREQKHPSGFVACIACNGSGWAGGIVLPEIAQSAPVSGIVVSIGPECVNLKLGDSVLHSKYAGHTVTTPEGESYTTMHEHEVLWLLRDL